MPSGLPASVRSQKRPRDDPDPVSMDAGASEWPQHTLSGTQSRRGRLRTHAAQSWWRALHATSVLPIPELCELVLQYAGTWFLTVSEKNGAFARAFDLTGLELSVPPDQRRAGSSAIATIVECDSHPSARSVHGDARRRRIVGVTPPTVHRVGCGPERGDVCPDMWVGSQGDRAAAGGVGDLDASDSKVVRRFHHRRHRRHGQTSVQCAFELREPGRPAALARYECVLTAPHGQVCLSVERRTEVPAAGDTLHPPTIPGGDALPAPSDDRGAAVTHPFRPDGSDPHDPDEDPDDRADDGMQLSVVGVLDENRVLMLVRLAEHIWFYLLRRSDTPASGSARSGPAPAPLDPTPPRFTCSQVARYDPPDTHVNPVSGCYRVCTLAGALGDVPHASSVTPLWGVTILVFASHVHLAESQFLVAEQLWFDLSDSSAPVRLVPFDAHRIRRLLVLPRPPSAVSRPVRPGCLKGWLHIESFVVLPEGQAVALVVVPRPRGNGMTTARDARATRSSPRHLLVYDFSVTTHLPLTWEPALVLRTPLDGESVLECCCTF